MLLELLVLLLTNYCPAWFLRSKFWLMPVLRKFGVHKGAVRNIKISERNGSLSSSHAASASSLLSHLTIYPIYHKPAPNLPRMTPLQFEVLLFGYLMATLAVQYINIYKTSLYVIDLHLALLICIIVARRLSWLAVKETLAPDIIQSSTYWTKVLCRALLVLTLTAASIWSFYCVVQNSSFEDVLFLCYPFVVYIGAFGLTLNPYGHKALVKLGSHQSQVVQELIASNTSSFFKSSTQSQMTHMPINENFNQSNESQNNVEEPVQNGQAIQNGSISGNGHIDSTVSKCQENHCSFSPDSARYEAECLRTDFYLRIKQVFFNSIVSAYYVGFIPVKFTQSGWLSCDVRWTVQFVFFVWLNAFIFLMNYLMPFVYIDGLHRCAMHLGSWNRYYGNRETQHTWSPLTIWPQGVLVKHSKVTYRAVGRQNTAVPGDSSQSRLYFIFNNPLRLINMLVLLQLFLSVYELYALICSKQWHQVLSLVILLGSSYLILFRLLRERWAVQATLEDHEACAGT